MRAPRFVTAALVASLPLVARGDAPAQVAALRSASAVAGLCRTLSQTAVPKDEALARNALARHYEIAVPAKSFELERGGDKTIFEVTSRGWWTFGNSVEIILLGSQSYLVHVADEAAGDRLIAAWNKGIVEVRFLIELMGGGANALDPDETLPDEPPCIAFPQSRVWKLSATALQGLLMIDGQTPLRIDVRCGENAEEDCNDHGDLWPRAAYVAKGIVIGEPTCDPPRACDTSLLHRTIVAHSVGLRGCYLDAVRSHDALAGGIVLRLLVTPGGKIRESKIAMDTVGDPKLAACLVDRVRQIVLPEPRSEGKLVIIHLPTRLSESQDGGMP